MLSYWNETLQNVSQDQRKDKFVFVVNKIRYDVPLSFALGISPYITHQYLNNPTFREFEINDKEKIEEEFLNFIRGKEIRNETFIKFGKILKNKEMIKKWKNSNELTKERAIEYLKLMHEIEEVNNNKDTKYFIYKGNNEDIKEEIDFIVKHFEEMKEEIKKLKVEDIFYILRKEDISIKSEDTIWEITKDQLKELKREINEEKSNKIHNERNRKLRRLLLNNIQIKYLDKNNLKEYIEEIESEDFLFSPNGANEDQNIWNQIQEIILSNFTIIDDAHIEEKKKQEEDLK